MPLLVISVLWAMDFTASPAGAQCDRWLPMDRGVYSYGWVPAFVQYGDQLIIGGGFAQAGGEDAGNLASWDGVTLRSFPGEVHGEVNALAVYRDDLIVAGRFDQISDVPASNIARWDGTQWHALGSGLDREATSLLVHDDNLIVGGRFTTAGGVESPGVARWNGLRWREMAEGLSGGYGWGPAARALVEYQGLVVAVGSFDHAGSAEAANVALWDGWQWHALGSGVEGFQADAACVFEGDLIVGGLIRLAGGREVQNVARWDGQQWNPMGKGLSDGYHSAEVWALRVVDDTLYAGGDFDRSGVSLANIAQWDGSGEWQSVGAGVDGRVCAITEFQDELLIGGLFRHSQGEPVKSLAMWQSHKWTPLGAGVQRSGGFTALVEFNGQLTGGGFFRLADETAFPSMASWNGADWQGLPALPSAVDASVESMAAYRNELIVGGSTNSTVYGMHQDHIARWDGEHWKSLGEGTDQAPMAMLVHGDDLIVGGKFSRAGGKRVSYIARWDGRDWHPFGTGLNGPVRALAIVDGELVAGGWFYENGDGEPMDGIARWDGAHWRSFAGGVRCQLEAMTLYQGELVVAGNIWQPGDVDQHIARWDGQAWQPLGSGMDNTVEALCVYHGDLIATGYFLTAGGQSVNHIARWDGQQWHPMGDGLDGIGLTLSVFDDTLIVGGGFTLADGVYVNGVAQWRDCQSKMELAVEANCPQGGLVTVSWSGATPGGSAALVYASVEGTFVVPSGPCAGSSLGLGEQGVQVAWRGQSQSNGSGTVHASIPPDACGGFVQLIDLATCGTSNVARIE